MKVAINHFILLSSLTLLLILIYEWIMLPMIKNLFNAYENIKFNFKKRERKREKNLSQSTSFIKHFIPSSTRGLVAKIYDRILDACKKWWSFLTFLLKSSNRSENLLLKKSPKKFCDIILFSMIYK